MMAFTFPLNGVSELPLEVRENDDCWDGFVVYDLSVNMFEVSLTTVPLFLSLQSHEKAFLSSG